MIQKILKLLIITLCLFLTLPILRADAASNFTTDYNVTYTITETGLTHAKLQGTLTNTSSQYYASSYKMQVGFENITNVKASDSERAITPQVTKNENGYVITLVFNKKSVGTGSKLPFTITFDTPTIAKQFGRVWEINIPGIANPEDFSSFTVHVDVPKSFGNPAYIKPAQTNKDLTFTKEQLHKSGISIGFGDQQAYSFVLKYHLKNDNVYPIRTEIALPPSTNYQEVFLNTISPEPINVKEDTDGNWLAEYKLKPTEKLDINVTGVIKVTLAPAEQSLAPDQFAAYLKERPYWGTSKKEVQDIAHKLKTPRAIYDFVVANLTYDFSRVTDDKERLGAAGALKNPSSAVCREFTDLFITLARAAGIPAREVDGFAHTENSKQRPLSLLKDILHAWPEYYDQHKKTWVMVDPTWGSTTGGVDYFDVLDFDHVAFVIKGKDSDYPIPAGGYKLLDSNDDKDIEVNFSNTIPVKASNASVTATFPEVSIAGLPLSGTVTVKNASTTRIAPQAFFIESKTLTPNQQVITSAGIPPFGYQTWNVSFNRTPFLTKANETFTIRFAQDSDLGGKTTPTTIAVAPFFLTQWGIGGITVGILTIILLTITLKIRRVRLPKR